MVKINWSKYVLAPLLSLSLVINKGDSLHLDNYSFRHFLSGKPHLLSKGFVKEFDNHYVVKGDFYYKGSKISFENEKDSMFVFKNLTDFPDDKNFLYFDKNSFKTNASNINIKLPSNNPLLNNEIGPFSFEFDKDYSLDIVKNNFNNNFKINLLSDDFVFDSGFYGTFIANNKNVKFRKDSVKSSQKDFVKRDKGFLFNFNDYCLDIDSHLVNPTNKLENFVLEDYLTNFNKSKTVFNKFFNEFLKDYSYASFKEIFFNNNLSEYPDYFFNSILTHSISKLSNKVNYEEDIKNILSVIINEPGLGADPFDLNYSFLNYSLKTFVDEYSSKEDFLNKYRLINKTFGDKSNLFYLHALPSLSKLGFNIDESISLSKKILEIPHVSQPHIFRKTFPLFLKSKSVDESLDLIDKISSYFEDSSGEVLNKFSNNILFESDKLEDAFDGISIYLKYAKGDKYFHKYLNEDNFEFSLINSKEDFVKQISSVFGEFKGLNRYDYKNISKFINKVHDNEILLDKEDYIRDYLSKSSSFNLKYHLISSSETELYPSSFLSLYNYFPKDLSSSISHIDIDKKYLNDFVRTLALRSKFTEVINKEPSFFKESLEDLLSTSPNKSLSYNAYFLAESVSEIFEENDDLSQYFEKFLFEKYDSLNNNLKNANDSINLDIYSFLIKLNKNPSPEFVDRYNEINFELSNNIDIPDFLDDNVLAVKKYFYSNEEFAFSEYVKKLKDEGLKLIKIDDSEYHFRKNFEENKLDVVLSKNIKTFNDDMKNDFFDIICFRGHSTDLRVNSFKDSNKEKLFYLGSCNSYREVPRLINKFPNSFFISNKYVGQGWISNIVTYNIFENILAGVKDFENLENNSSRDFKNVGLVFPSDISHSYLKSVKK